MSDSLKPCPFCGGEAVIQKQYRSGGFRAVYWAACINCVASTFNMKRDSEEEVVAWWNRRYPEPLSAGEGLPKEYENVLAWSPMYPWPTVAHVNSSFEWIHRERGVVIPVTHWMRLPEPTTKEPNGQP